MTDHDAQARSDLRLEEYRLLKAEISTLDARVERGISTVLGINALVLTVIYLGILPLLIALQIQLDEELLNSLKLPLFYVLILLNAVLGSRYFFMTKHIDKIGGYIARLEWEIYRKPETPPRESGMPCCEHDKPLGWELSMRGGAPVDVKKDNTIVDTFRRMIFWVLVGVMNIAALLDLHCFIPLTGLTECPVP